MLVLLLLLAGSLASAARPGRGGRFVSSAAECAEAGGHCVHVLTREYESCKGESMGHCQVDSVGNAHEGCCPGPSSIARPCNGHGQRSAGGICVCEKGWTGEECAFPHCPNDCSGNGECIEGSCVCDEGFNGTDCSGTGAYIYFMPPSSTPSACCAL